MTTRIFLVHAYRHSMPPIDHAFRDGWPEAEAVNLLDELLYADVDADGVPAPSVGTRLESLFRHCALSRADGIVFTGSTFGPLVDTARASVTIPVLKADESAAELAVSRGRRILLVCTARRAIPVIERNLQAAAGKAGRPCVVTTLSIDGAKEAISRGRLDEHARLIAEGLPPVDDVDVILFGQMSMQPARALLSDEVLRKLVTTPEAAVSKMREVLLPRAVAETR